MEREALETKLAARVADLRERATALQVEADRIGSAIQTDHAFWTQPAYGNAAGRAFARSRDRERAKIVKSFSIAAEAKALRDKADSMERRGVVMAGDAARARASRVAAVDMQVGQMVDTTHYGIRRVVKVNRTTVCVEGAFGPLKIGKEFVRAVPLTSQPTQQEPVTP